MVFTSNFPDVEIPDTTITNLILSSCDKFGDKVAVEDGPSGRSYTFTQVKALIISVANNLKENHGFEKGDVMGIILPNLPEFPILFHGVNLLGGTNTTVNVLYTDQEIATQLVDSKAKAVVSVGLFGEKVMAACASAGVSKAFFLGEGAPEAVEGVQVLDAKTLFAPNLKAVEVDIDPAESVAVLPYSSGTTGIPKGVMLTHRNLVANLFQILTLEPVTSDDVLIGILPFFHIYGMMVICNVALYAGSTVVTMPRFDMEGFLNIVQAKKVTRAHLVPPIILGLTRHPIVSQFDLSSLKVILSGAAPLGEELQVAASEQLKVIIKQGYGMSELSPVCHIVHEDCIKPGSIGVLAPNTLCKIVSTETGEEVGVGESGELCIAGPQVMKGYLGRPDETAHCMEGEFLHTGDIGYVDDSGNYFIVDRVKELIKFKGFQVPPAELESKLLGHEAVADCAVIPSPDEEAGEVPKAYIVLKPGKEITAEEIMEYIAAMVSPHKRIRLVEFVDEIPKSASGKILRRVLVQKERERIASASSSS